MCAVARIGAGFPKVLAGALQVAAVQGGPPPHRQRVHARVSGEHGVGLVELASRDPRSRQSQPQRFLRVSPDAVVQRGESCGGGVELPVIDQHLDQHRLRQRLRVGRGPRIHGDALQHRPRVHPVAGVEECPRRVGARPPRELRRYQVGVACERQSAHPLGLGAYSPSRPPPSGRRG